MIGKLIGAAVGRRLAGDQHKGRGELLGYFAPALIRGGTKGLVVLAVGGWAAKKAMDWRSRRRAAA